MAEPPHLLIQQSAKEVEEKKLAREKEDKELAEEVMKSLSKFDASADRQTAYDHSCETSAMLTRISAIADEQMSGITQQYGKDSLELRNILYRTVDRVRHVKFVNENKLIKTQAQKLINLKNSLMEDRAKIIASFNTKREELIRKRKQEDDEHMKEGCSDLQQNSGERATINPNRLPAPSTPAPELSSAATYYGGKRPRESSPSDDKRVRPTIRIEPEYVSIYQPLRSDPTPDRSSQYHPDRRTQEYHRHWPIMPQHQPVPRTPSNPVFNTQPPTGLRFNHEQRKPNSRTPLPNGPVAPQAPLPSPWVDYHQRQYAEFSKRLLATQTFREGALPTQGPEQQASKNHTRNAQAPNTQGPNAIAQAPNGQGLNAQGPNTQRANAIAQGLIAQGPNARGPNAITQGLIAQGPNAIAQAPNGQAPIAQATNPQATTKPSAPPTHKFPVIPRPPRPALNVPGPKTHVKLYFTIRNIRYHLHGVRNFSWTRPHSCPRLSLSIDSANLDLAPYNSLDDCVATHPYFSIHLPNIERLEYNASARLLIVFRNNGGRNATNPNAPFGKQVFIEFETEREVFNFVKLCNEECFNIALMPKSDELMRRIFKDHGWPESKEE